MDLGRPKKKFSQNWPKWVPLRRACRANSGHILFFWKWTLYAKVITFWSISEIGKKVNYSKSTGHTIDVNSTSTSCHDDVRNDTWKHKEVTRVTHFCNFEVWCGLVKKVTHGIIRRWHVALYGCNTCTYGIMMWPNDSLMHGSTNDDIVGDVETNCACWLGGLLCIDWIVQSNPEVTCGPIRGSHMAPQI